MAPRSIPMFALGPSVLLFALIGSAAPPPVADAELGTTPDADPVASVTDAPSAVEFDPFADRPLELMREAPERARATFGVRVKDVVVPYRVLAITARPGERISLSVERAPVAGTAGTPIEGTAIVGAAVEGAPVEAPPVKGALGGADADSEEAFRLRSPEGIEAPVSPGHWSWTAPMVPGPVPLRIESLRDGEAITLNVLVLHAFEEAEGGSMNGFRIGEYRISESLRPPDGFVEAAEDVLDLRVAPGFTLRQFLPHQAGAPRYLALSEPLLLKLEAILEEVRAAGIDARTLHVMSAFRTPYYNRAIGNTTDASRHLWGDAADIFIDETGDGWMDDLTGDGRGGEADARLLYRIVERVEARQEPHVRAGGLSLYPANDVRGPFLHVDARGVPARW